MTCRIFPLIVALLFALQAVHPVAQASDLHNSAIENNKALWRKVTKSVHEINEPIDKRDYLLAALVGFRTEVLKAADNADLTPTEKEQLQSFLAQSVTPKIDYLESLKNPSGVAMNSYAQLIQEEMESAIVAETVVVIVLLAIGALIVVTFLGMFIEHTTTTPTLNEHINFLRAEQDRTEHLIERVRDLQLRNKKYSVPDRGGKTIVIRPPISQIEEETYLMRAHAETDIYNNQARFDAQRANQLMASLFCLIRGFSSPQKWGSNAAQSYSIAQLEVKKDLFVVEMMPGWFWGSYVGIWTFPAWSGKTYFSEIECN